MTSEESRRNRKESGPAARLRSSHFSGTSHYTRDVSTLLPNADYVSLRRIA